MIGNFDTGHLYFHRDHNDDGEGPRTLYINCFCGEHNIKSSDLGKLCEYRTILFYKRFNCPKCNMDLMFVCDYSNKDPFTTILLDPNDEQSWVKAIMKYPNIIKIVPDEYKTNELLLVEKLS